MKKNSSLKDIFSASMTLQADEESFNRFSKIAAHLSKTGMIVMLSVLIAHLLFVLIEKRALSDFEYLPLLLLVVVFVRYIDLHRQTLKLLGGKKKASKGA